MPEFSEEADFSDMPALEPCFNYKVSPTAALDEKRLLLDGRIGHEGFEVRWLPVDCDYMWCYTTPFGMHDESIPFDADIFEGADRDFDAIADHIVSDITAQRPERCVEEGCQDTMVMGFHRIVEDCDRKGMTVLHYNIQCAKHGMWPD